MACRGTRVRSGFGCRTMQIVLVLMVVSNQAVVRAADDCAGDCNASIHVTVDELVAMVNIALGNADLSVCTAGDVNGDAQITVDELVGAVQNALEGCSAAESRRTLDDSFEDVARLVPDFGGMSVDEDEQALDVYLLDPSAEKVAAVASAITQVFGPIVPAGGIRALEAQYGFSQLRGWYRALVGPILSIAGVVVTDIDEAANRLAIGIETPAAEPQIGEALSELGIPSDAVVITLMEPIEPLGHTLRDVQSPRRGGYQIGRLINNTAGFGLVTPTLGFNATRGGVPGFVTNSHNTQVFWNLDTNGGFPPADFYQALYSPAEWVGTEAVDTQAFPCAAPYPSGHWCRYSDSAFVRYNTGVAYDPGIIGKTTAPTVLSPTSASHVLTVDHTAAFTIISAPTQPYLAGLRLHKVGRTTGWTTGMITSTCVDYVQTNPFIHPGTTVRPCQYVLADFPFGLATFGDSGSPVFRLVDPHCGYVELYGIAWGGGSFFVPPAPWSGGSVGRVLAFSPIGGVPFQQSGVQSPQDLGSLSYTTMGTCQTATPTSATAVRTPTPTPTPSAIQGCAFIGPRMCGGDCRTPTDVCQPLPDDSGCECRPGPPTQTPTPTLPQPCGFIGPRMCGGACPAPADVCVPLPDDSGCVCQPGGPTPTQTPTPTATATATGCATGPVANLVLNPGFESFSSIPTGLGQLNLAAPWQSPSNGSPDYFHSLATAASGVSVPANTFGNESAHNGRAYVGFHVRPINLYREYVEVSLSSPLVAGNTYQVSFYLSLADGSRWAVDKLGAHFSAGSVSPVNTAYVLSLPPHVSVSGYLTNKTGWTQVVGSYTALGSEDHIVIGNFLDNPSTTPLMGLGGPYEFAYYYLDDVSVVPVPCTPTPTASSSGTPMRTPT